MEPYYENKTSQLHVGIGEINPNAMIGKTRYDPTFNGYAPLKGDKSAPIGGIKPPSPVDPNGKKGDENQLIYIFIGVGAAVLIIFVVSVIYCCRKRNKGVNKTALGAEGSDQKFLSVLDEDKNIRDPSIKNERKSQAYDIAASDRFTSGKMTER